MLNRNNKPKYPNSRRFFRAYVSECGIVASCALYHRGRQGFAHECDIKDTRTGKSALVHVNYLNRTWESFEYETVLKEGLSAIGIVGKDADTWMDKINQYRH